MSNHKNPLYNTPEITQALKDHGLEINNPSQLSDAFRAGFIANKKENKIHISISFPNKQGSYVYDELQYHPIPKVGEHIMIPIYTYKNGQRDNDYTYFEGVVDRILHLPHPTYPQVWIKTRNFNWLDKFLLLFEWKLYKLDRN